MSRIVVSAVFAVGCAVALAANAQDTKTKTTIKGDNVATVTYSGCVQTGTEATSYTLDKVVPVSRTTREVAGTGGVSTVTTYALVPGEKVELQRFVGRKVEVTGMMVGGDGKTKTETKIEREDAPDTKITEKTKGSMPQFHVISIKQTAEAC